MTKSIRAIVMGAALTGLLAGTTAMAQTGDKDTGKKTTTDKKAGDKHSCKGQNSCKGKGGCSAGDNGCKGHNSCKGKGGCATDGSKDKKTPFESFVLTGRGASRARIDTLVVHPIKLDTLGLRFCQGLRRAKKTRI